MKSLITQYLKYQIVENIKNNVFSTGSNTYIGIGRPIRWGADNTETSDEIEDVSYTTNYRNQVYRDLVAVKKIQAADLALVVPRVDWVSGVKYDPYEDHIQLYSHDGSLTLGTVNANVDVQLTGRVNVTTSNVVVGNTTGANATYFTGNVFVGDTLRVNSESRLVVNVTNNNHLVVNSAFTNTGVNNTYSVSANAYIVRSNTAVFAGNLVASNVVQIGTETKEIVSLRGDFSFSVNSAIQHSYASNVSMIRISNTYPKFANNFYVRNSKDQVFKCLFNSNTNSTVEPTIDIDGQLPENPYILTGDNYKWKYLYTIPYGLKQKFFTSTWMPVVKDNAVVAGSIDGRIDIITIENGGSGYYTVGQSGNSNTLAIITVTGDGTGANVTAKVASGVITDLNILNGGQGYTKATVIAVDEDQTTSGNDAVFNVIIGPPGGHGIDPARELGCYSVMATVELDEDENGKIPVSSASGDFDFRQISLIRNPLLSNGYYANASVYTATSKLTVTDPGVTNFQSDETVYIGSSLSSASFTATVVYWDSSTNELYLNNLDGTIGTAQSLTGSNSAAVSTILTVEDPELELFTGDLLYIENRLKIVRDIDQSEQIRLILSF